MHANYILSPTFIFKNPKLLFQDLETSTIKMSINKPKSEIFFLKFTQREYCTKLYINAQGFTWYFSVQTILGRSNPVSQRGSIWDSVDIFVYTFILQWSRICFLVSEILLAFLKNCFLEVSGNIISSPSSSPKCIASCQLKLFPKNSQRYC